MTAVCNIYFTPTKVTSFVDRNVYTLQSCSASVSPKSTGDRDHGSPNESSKVDAGHQQCMHPPPTAVPHLTTVPPVSYSHTQCLQAQICTDFAGAGSMVSALLLIQWFLVQCLYPLCNSSHRPYQRAGSPPEVIFRCIYQPPAFVGTYADANHQSLPWQLQLGRHLQVI